MIKTIGRILVILLVTALVAGGLYALVQGSSANSASASVGRQFDNRTLTAANPGRQGEREHGFGGGASVGRGLGGLLVTLLQIGAITFIVLQVQKLLSKPSGRGLPAQG